MSPKHGTGAIFLRNFRAYPPDLLCNAFIGSGEGNGVANDINLNGARWPKGVARQLRALPRRLVNRIPRVAWRPLPVSRSAVAKALRESGFQPDVLYGICWGAEGLAVLAAVADAYPRVPLLLHLHDIWPSSTPAFPVLLRKVAKRSAAVLTITEAMGTYVEKATGKPVEIENPFHIDMPSAHAVPDGSDAKTFRAIIIGNIWNYALVNDLKNIWRICRQRMPSLPPIELYCHAESLLNAKANGFAPEPELRHAGFLKGSQLWEMLRNVDLAIVPFSRGVEPADDYERYSIPSRITELVAAGLPIFALAGPRTPLAAYLCEKGIGLSRPAAETEAAAADICSLVADRAKRRQLGSRARAVAEREFPLAPYQQDFYARLSKLAFGCK